MTLSSLWQPAVVNPANGKSLTLPLLRPWDKYGRCFHLSWLGFFVAFLSWFAFPPLQASITKDLGLSPKQVSNSNIIGLSATLVTRVILGPLSDRFGPRYVMVGTLLVGALPTAMVPLVTNVHGLYAIRFFVGILGGTFVPCQLWTTAFFDTPIVGRANALAGGWGNAGGGVAFFMMPAIATDLLHRGFTPSRAWKLPFAMGPLVIIICVALAILVFGYDCPEGKWADRASINLATHSAPALAHPDEESIPSPQPNQSMEEKRADSSKSAEQVAEVMDVGNGTIVDLQTVIEDPTITDIFKTALKPETWLVALPYATTFGGELAFEAIVSAFYLAISKQHGENWNQQLAGDWGSMVGLLNVVTRPLGGFISDILYDRFHTVQVKKYLMLTCGLMQGIFFLWIGLAKSVSIDGLIVGVVIMAFFMEAGNGANFSLVPHISPHHTGIVAGLTGAAGNMGGILFSLAFRFQVSATGQTEYQTGIWNIGVAVIAINVLCVLIPLRKKAK